MSTDADEWLLRPEAAKYLGISFSTLAHMVGRGEGPRFYSYGNKARYRKSDLDKWIRSKAVEPLPQALQEFSRRRRGGGFALDFNS
jgi:excisionase family DNA binding protein